MYYDLDYSYEEPDKYLIPDPRPRTASLTITSCPRRRSTKQWPLVVNDGNENNNSYFLYLRASSDVLSSWRLFVWRERYIFRLNVQNDGPYLLSQTHYLHSLWLLFKNAKK